MPLRELKVCGRISVFFLQNKEMARYSANEIWSIVLIYFNCALQPDKTLCVVWSTKAGSLLLKCLPFPRLIAVGQHSPHHQSVLSISEEKCWPTAGGTASLLKHEKKKNTSQIFINLTQTIFQQGLSPFVLNLFLMEVFCGRLLRKQFEWNYIQVQEDTILMYSNPVKL